MKTENVFARVLILLLGGVFAAAASASMLPMDQVGPESRAFNPRDYQHLVHVVPGADLSSVTRALAAIHDAGPENRYAIVVAAGKYPESKIQMKEYVDLFGGFDGKDWRARDVYANATILDGGQDGPVVIGADNARLDGFVVTGGLRNAHGAGILCDGASPVIANNIIAGNRTTMPAWLKPGMGIQECHDGAGIALLDGSNAYVANNLVCDNTTEAGAGAGIAVRGCEGAKILRNVFCNNTTGLKDDSEFEGHIGTRSSPGAGIFVSGASSPLVAFNVVALGEAPFKNDAGGIFVEGNSTPRIHYNWVVGNICDDDGGGLYLMGKFYNDELGKRHASCPDEPVVVEDNLIAGNDSITGGPAGLRVSKYGRAVLRRNLIVGNLGGGAGAAGGGEIILSEGNIDTDNTLEAARVRLTGNVTGSSFDPARHVTEIATDSVLPDDLAGGVARVGKQFSVVKANEEKKLIVWGRLDVDAPSFDILDDYGWKPKPSENE